MKRRVIQKVGRAMREALSGLEELAGQVPEKAKGMLGGYPPINLYERSDVYVVRAEVAGVEAEDLDVTMEGRSVTIRGIEREQAGYEEMTCHLCEREQGEFCRTVDLPEDVDEEADPEATLRQGVLTIRVPRERAARTKRVKVSEPEEEQAGPAEKEREPEPTPGPVPGDQTTEEPGGPETQDDDH